jgi:hypothetical protein
MLLFTAKCHSGKFNLTLTGGPTGYILGKNYTEDIQVGIVSWVFGCAHKPFPGMLIAVYCCCNNAWLLSTQPVWLFVQAYMLEFRLTVSGCASMYVKRAPMHQTRSNVVLAWRQDEQGLSDNQSNLLQPRQYHSSYGLWRLRNNANPTWCQHFCCKCNT